MKNLLFGCAYYPEHDPENQWELDAGLMAEIGFNVIRVGEFCWSRMQRSDRALTLDWLERLVALFDSYGIKTILCTPTATPPVWVADRFPDLSIELPDGRKGLFGGRRHYSVFHEGYRELSKGIAAGLADRFGHNPGVIGWHVDNEVGSYGIVDCSPPAARAFHAHLAETYGTVEELNRRWGLIFWNQEVERFDQVPAPTEMMTTRNPQYLLAYNRFCLDGLSEYILAQAREIRRRCSPDQWIVGSCHENVGYRLFAKQREEGEGVLDYVEFNNYPELHPEPGQAAMHIDRQRSIDRPRRFLTLEQQTGSGHTTSGGMDGRVRWLWAWETLARGSLSILWFQWRRFRTGCEWRLPSVVERDRKPRSVYRDLQTFIGEAKTCEQVLLDAKVVADVQVFVDPDSVIARDRASEEVFWMEIQRADGWQHRFPLWEKEVRRAVYQPLCGLGLTVDFVQAHEEWDRDKPLIIPDMDLCTRELVSKVQAFCEAGGYVICFPGVGERDVFGAQLDAPSPGMLGPLFGVELDDYYPLPAGSGSIYDPALGRMTDRAATAVDTTAEVTVDGTALAVDVRHGEILAVRDAQVIGTYTGGPCDGTPAITSRKVGKGCALYLGALPRDAESACGLYETLLPGIVGPRTSYNVVKLATADARYEFLLNDSPDACPLSESVSDLITGNPIAALAPFGVALVKLG